MPLSQSQSPARVALVTGASSGIGKATAHALAAAGFVVYAGARRPDALADLESAGLCPVRLDVTDEDSLVGAVRAAEAEHGAVDVLVNNAGYGELGAVEEVAADRWRRQFDTNVVGPVRLAQLVLPNMRRQHRGRIINVGSMGGELTFPFGGAYHASKYAIEALSDALRVEVKPFGVDVVVIQPGVVRTPLGDASIAALRTTPDSPYAAMVAGFERQSRASFESGRGILVPERVAVTIVAAAQARRPRTRYKVGTIARILPVLRHALPDRAWDALMGHMAGGAAAASTAPAAHGA